MPSFNGGHFQFSLPPKKGRRETLGSFLLGGGYDFLAVGVPGFGDDKFGMSDRNFVQNFSVRWAIFNGGRIGKITP